MNSPRETQATRILQQALGGDGAAASRLFPLVYEELRELAAQCLHRERPGHTLQPTALVHEAFLRLIGAEHAVHYESRRHFFAVAATAMRRALVDHARAKGTAKRGGGRLRLTLDPSAAVQHGPDLDLLALDQALRRLAELDERLARVVELRFFAGMSVEEVATTLAVSPRTVESDWRMARAWLMRELAEVEQH